MSKEPSRQAGMPSRPASAQAGHLVLIGGALDEDAALLDRIVSLALSGRDGRTSAEPTGGRARIAILTTASLPATSAASAASATDENDEADGRYYVELFARHGATGVPIPVGVSPAPSFAGSEYHRAAADSETLAALVHSCDGVFLGGGDQTHYLLSLFRAARDSNSRDAHDRALLFGERRDTAVLRAIRELLDRGGVIAGTSAGLAVQQSAPMVSGGTSSEAWLHGAVAGYEDDDRLRYVPAGGLGFFGEALLDSHFNEWGRVARAVRLAFDTGVPLAVGVDEHTALVYDRSTRIGEVVGTGGVSLLDVSDAELGEGAHGAAAVGVRWSHLTSGDRHDFRTGDTRRVEVIRVAPGTASAPEPARDVWAEDRGLSLLRLAQRLVASPERIAHAETGDTRHPGGQKTFRLTLQRDERTTWTEAGGFSRLCLSLTPNHPPQHTADPSLRKAS